MSSRSCFWIFSAVDVAVKSFHIELNLSSYTVVELWRALILGLLHPFEKGEDDLVLFSLLFGSEGHAGGIAGVRVEVLPSLEVAVTGLIQGIVSEGDFQLSVVLFVQLLQALVSLLAEGALEIGEDDDFSKGLLLGVLDAAAAGNLRVDFHTLHFVVADPAVRVILNGKPSVNS